MQTTWSLGTRELSVESDWLASVFRAVTMQRKKNQSFLDYFRNSYENYSNTIDVEFRFSRLSWANQSSMHLNCESTLTFADPGGA